MSDGWVSFGAHADESLPCYPAFLIFSTECGEDGFPLWERHDGCTLLAEPQS